MIFTDNISFINTDPTADYSYYTNLYKGGKIYDRYTNKLSINLSYPYSGPLTDGAINSNSTSLSLNLASGYHKTRIVIGDTLEYNSTEAALNFGFSASGINYSYIYPDDMIYFGLSDIKEKFVNNSDEYSEDSEGPRLTRVIRPHTWEYDDLSSSEICNVINMRSEQQLEVPSNDLNGTTVEYFRIDIPEARDWQTAGATRVGNINYTYSGFTYVTSREDLELNFGGIWNYENIVMKDNSGNQSRYTTADINIDNFTLFDTSSVCN